MDIPCIRGPVVGLGHIENSAQNIATETSQLLPQHYTGIFTIYSKQSIPPLNMIVALETAVASGMKPPPSIGVNL